MQWLLWLLTILKIVAFNSPAYAAVVVVVVFAINSCFGRWAGFCGCSGNLWFSRLSCFLMLVVLATPIIVGVLLALVTRSCFRL